MKQPTVSIILLNMNQPALTLACIDSLQKVTYPNVEIIVIDQNSSDNSVELLSQLQNVHFIASKENLGFTGGNNLGMQKANGDFYLLLNNDTEVAASFLEPMVMALSSDPKAGAASPLIRFYNNPEFIQYAGGPDKIDLIKGKNSWKGWQTATLSDLKSIEKTSAAHGAAFMIKKSAATEIGLLDDNFFIYFEEIDWSLRITRGGQSILFVPQAEVYHKESMTMPKEHPFRVRMMARNRILLSRKHLPRYQFIRSILYVTLISFPMNCLRYLIRRKISLLTAYTKGFFQGAFNLPYTTI